MCINITDSYVINNYEYAINSIRTGYIDLNNIDIHKNNNKIKILKKKKKKKKKIILFFDIKGKKKKNIYDYFTYNIVFKLLDKLLKNTFSLFLR